MGIAANDIEYSELIENFAVHFGHANVALRGRSMRPLRWPIQFFYTWPLSLLGRPKASARRFFRMDLDKCIKSNLGTTCNPALINVSTICIDVKKGLIFRLVFITIIVIDLISTCTFCYCRLASQNVPYWVGVLFPYFTNHQPPE